jgi:hypothetical protein
MGATLSLATIAVAIDHTQHKLPEVESTSAQEQEDVMQQGTPCGLGVAPCSLGGGGDF